MVGTHLDHGYFSSSLSKASLKFAHKASIEARVSVKYKLYATELPYLAVCCSRPLLSTEVTFPTCRPPSAGTQSGVPIFKIPSPTSAPTIIRVLLVEHVMGENLSDAAEHGNTVHIIGNETVSNLVLDAD